MRAFAIVTVVLLLTGCASTGPRQGGEEPDDKVVAEDPCNRVAGLAADGEIKPAVDEMAALERQGTACSDKVAAAVGTARAQLAEADALVRSPQASRQEGYLSGAAAELEGALAIYPKYYWAKKQL